MLGRLLSTTLQLLPKNAPIGSTCSSVIAAPNTTNAWSLDFIRSRVRYHFQYPNERRRILRHGFQARMATPNGRKIIMRRILKGRYWLSH